jgi:anaerobic sulfite reductase subunit C
MKWSPEAEDSIRKIPFIIRKRVRSRVEEEARKRRKTAATRQDIDATKQRYLHSMSSERKG